MVTMAVGGRDKEKERIDVYNFYFWSAHLLPHIQMLSFLPCQPVSVSDDGALKRAKKMLKKAKC